MTIEIVEIMGRWEQGVSRFPWMALMTPMDCLNKGLPYHIRKRKTENNPSGSMGCNNNG